MVPAMTAKCPDCGHEFRNVQVSGSVTAFFDRLAQADAKAQENPAENKTDVKGNIKLLLGMMGAAVVFVIINEFLELIDFEAGQIMMGGAVIVIITAMFLFVIKKVTFSKTDNQRKGLIETFPIPNTKEDLLEFLILASSHIVPANGFTYAARKQQIWNKIWATKCRQVYTKADIAFAGDKESLATVNNVREKTEASLARARTQAFIAAGVAAALVIFCVGAFIVRREGVGIAVPESVTIAPEHVTLRGAFSESLKVTGSGVTITTDKAVSYVKMTVELEVLEDPDSVIEQAVKRLAETNKINRQYVTYKEDYVTLTVNSTDIWDLDDILPVVHYSYDSTPYYAAIQQLKPGTSQVITVFDRKTNGKTPAGIRKGVAQFMARNEVELKLGVTFELLNMPGVDDSKSGINYSKKLSWN
jgi:hypothetical protein